MGAVENILVIRFKSIGDVLFTLPAIHAIRDNFPKAKITFLTSEENAPLIEGFGPVQEIITVDRSVYRDGRLKLMVKETLGLMEQLRRKKFSLAIDFQGYGETALLTWLTRAPQRWGSVYRSTRRWAYTRGIRRDLSIHTVEWNLSLLRQCGMPIKSVCNEFILPPAAFREAHELFTRLRLNPRRPVLFIQPSTSSIRKNWPLENYLALADQWRKRGTQILFGGGPREVTMLEPAGRAGLAVSAGAPLLVSAGLMKLSTVIVGGDTGLVHLAAAMNKRVVLLAKATSKCYPFPHPDWKITPRDGSDVSGISFSAVMEACARAFVDAESHELCAEPHAH